MSDEERERRLEAGFFEQCATQLEEVHHRGEIAHAPHVTHLAIFEVQLVARANQPVCATDASERVRRTFRE